ncbi:SDR family oxidoreductase [Bradyrhizobium yuanmingense]|uniref:SDR family NAD(P)-dependent oxidoreductase n=1 Tax=Bradyrhizobium yuanmingense TaxID=108015 RepID=UPI0023BA01AC|nr:SDR family oxidoreductase [Bradyrhizobium yuanmingense]MDF0520127.1 SDR family oxidoreductase [Bradyrhizobium yuanmingense]
MIKPTSEKPVAVVTGGAKGIGFACAARLLASGFRVAITDISEPDLKSASASLGAGQGDLLALWDDVRSFDGVQSNASRILDAWGRFDVLVNSAGVSQPKGLLSITEQEWDLVIAVNLKGTFNWCKAVASHMVGAAAGRIINISSVNAHTGGTPSAVSKFAYAASKAGILGLTRGLAKELAPDVSVNAVCPGLIETALTLKMIGEQGKEMIARGIPLGRIGTPDDIAVIVQFIATVQPSYLTGEIIDVDGGAFIN